MKFYRLYFPGLLFICLLPFQVVLADSNQSINETFKNISLIKMKTLCGSVNINKWSSNEVKVSVINECRPQQVCDIKLRSRNSALYLEEHIKGSDNIAVRGCSHWTLFVPDKIEINFRSTSGSLKAADLNCIITGVSTSGSFEINNCRGIFEIASTSGDVDAIDIILDDYSSFGSTSGNVTIDLLESSQHDLNVGSTSGKAVLGYNGNPFIGRFELSAKKGSGEIVCSEDFDDIEGFEKMGQRYVMKSFKRKSRDPFIQLGTSSGKVVLK